MRCLIYNMEKIILDACCGGKMFWFNKKHPRVLYVDNRREKKGFIKFRPEFGVEPDRVMDFRKLKLKDKTFNLVVFDPPHLLSPGKNSWMRKKYGGLEPKNWKSDIGLGFDECWRVLKKNGVLIFKWNECDIPLREVLSVISKDPLFGHVTGQNSKTHWLCFMKL